ncbi:MAG: sensor histidine kinase [Flavobacteriales bacterium]|nr:sensor histidine kinase [Flavobacteriales bacterium]
MTSNTEALTDQVHILLILIAALVALFIFQEYRIKKVKKKSSHQRDAFQKLQIDHDHLVREAQHRVKNNMQIIASLMSIQERNAQGDEARSALEKSKQRVKSIALIHQGLLNKGRPQHVSAQEYIRTLSNSVFNAYKVGEEQIDLRTEVDDILLHIDTGLPLGLILNEMLSNCLQHAFTESSAVEVVIRLKHDHKKLILELEDSGTRLTPEELRERVGLFGSKMIDTFHSRLGSVLEVATEGLNTVRLVISNYDIHPIL